VSLPAKVALVSNAQLQNGRAALRASVVNVGTGYDKVEELASSV